MNEKIAATPLYCDIITAAFHASPCYVHVSHNVEHDFYLVLPPDGHLHPQRVSRDCL